MGTKVHKNSIPQDFPPETTFVLYDPTREYTIDHFGSEKTLRSYWHNPWKKHPHWSSRKRKCLGMEFDGGKNPKLLRVFYWKD